jgi:hypothetical protein
VIADRSHDIGRAVMVIEALLRGLDLVNRAPVANVLCKGRVMQRTRCGYCPCDITLPG